MITLTLPRRVGIRAFLTTLLHRWHQRQQRRRQLRGLNELPSYLLRDLGLDHLTLEERYRLGGYHQR